MRLFIYGHSRDCNNIQIIDDQGKKIVDEEGYVPHLTGIGGGDDLHFGIDLDTGMIVNWYKIKERLLEDVNVLINGEADEDDEDA